MVAAELQAGHSDEAGTRIRHPGPSPNVEKHDLFARSGIRIDRTPCPDDLVAVMVVAAKSNGNEQLPLWEESRRRAAADGSPRESGAGANVLPLAPASPPRRSGSPIARSTLACKITRVGFPQLVGNRSNQLVPAVGPRPRIPLYTSVSNSSFGMTAKMRYFASPAMRACRPEPG